MNREELKATDWAKRFKDECPTSYQEAIDLAVRIAANLRRRPGISYCLRFTVSYGRS